MTKLSRDSRAGSSAAFSFNEQATTGRRSLMAYSICARISPIGYSAVWTFT
jgi:hypothetical protein